MTQREIFFVANEVNELGGVGRWQAQMARLLARRHPHGRRHLVRRHGQRQEDQRHLQRDRRRL
ncbi:hypothetical protein ACWDAF_37945, partial [Streptomyces sp. NPDC001226]